MTRCLKNTAENIVQSLLLLITCPSANKIIVDNFRRHKLRGPEQDLKLLHRLEFSRQTEINDLDSVSTFGHTQNVFRLKRNYLVITSLLRLGGLVLKVLWHETIYTQKAFNTTFRITFVMILDL